MKKKKMPVTRAATLAAMEDKKAQRQQCFAGGGGGGDFEASGRCWDCVISLSRFSSMCKKGIAGNQVDQGENPKAKTTT